MSRVMTPIFKQLKYIVHHFLFRGQCWKISTWKNMLWLIEEVQTILSLVVNNRITEVCVALHMTSWGSRDIPMVANCTVVVQTSNGKRPPGKYSISHRQTITHLIFGVGLCPCSVLLLLVKYTALMSLLGTCQLDLGTLKTTDSDVMYNCSSIQPFTTVQLHLKLQDMLTTQRDWDWDFVPRIISLKKNN